MTRLNRHDFVDLKYFSNLLDLTFLILEDIMLLVGILWFSTVILFKLMSR